MKVVGWRVGVRVARRWGREVEPGARAGAGEVDVEVEVDDIFWGFVVCGLWFVGLVLAGGLIRV